MSRGRAGEGGGRVIHWQLCLCARSGGTLGCLQAPQERRSELSEEEQATVSLFQQNTPSVVNIANIGQRQDRWTMDVEKVPQGLGSGFIWDLKGHIVTNYHVSTCAAEVAALSG